MDAPRPTVPWRDLLPTALIPNVLHGSGQGAAVPVTLLAAMGLTESSAAAAVVAAMLTVGQLLLALPAGWLVSRLGERPVMLGSTAVTGLGGLAAHLASTMWSLAAGALLIGSGAAVFIMARHTWVTMAVPTEVRGRSLSALAGATRLGLFTGPMLAGGAIRLTGDVRGGFLVVVGTSALLAAVVALAPFPAAETDEGDPGERPRVFQVIRERRDVLLTLGLTVSVVSTMRTARRILVPLVGAGVGLDDVTVTLVVGLAAGLDFSLFYLGGVVTDRWGRLAVAVPALVAFAVSHLGLALAPRLPIATGWFLACTALMAMANGWSGGVVATMGSDLADPRSPAPFLGSWRLTTELGPSAAPFVIAALAGVLSLSAACVALAVLAGAAAAMLPPHVHRHLPRARR
ncbi:MFS transporter [Streptomyces sp. TRM68416]|uniref:MFS transporter n=1 Tax=Streptomyces sp. TRM68416 TaxID=2758412 RepID=UPI00166216E5|nr:MFS transporter [Streptomyces sp. TRM68416]MBD0843964.1 MFS transporter [Streptomyces sp. TRM68416]